MGQYLHIEIGYAMRVEKQGKWKKLDKTNLIPEISKNINLDLYNVSEDDDYLHISLKEEILTTYVKDFLIEQTELLGKEINEKDELFELIDSKDYEKMIKAAEDNEFYQWQSTQSFNYYLCGDLSHKVDYKAICFYILGKTYLECYNDFFVYITKLIKKTSDNPLKDTVIIGLD